MIRLAIYGVRVSDGIPLLYFLNEERIHFMHELSEKRQDLIEKYGPERFCGFILTIDGKDAYLIDIKR